MATKATEVETQATEPEPTIPEMSFPEMVDTLTTLTDQAEQAKSAKGDDPMVKVARAARTITNTFPEVFGSGDNAIATMPPGVVKWLDSASTLSPDAFDRTEGDLIASLFDSLSKVPTAYQPAGFGEVAESARAALDKWMSTRPGRRSGGNGGESTTPESQKLATFGIDSITITFATDNGAFDPYSITHGSTWSSLSDQINRAAKKVDKTEDAAPGTYSYQKVDPSAAQAWRAYVEHVKTDATYSDAFSVTLGKGTLNVQLKGNAKA